MPCRMLMCPVHARTWFSGNVSPGVGYATDVPVIHCNLIPQVALYGCTCVCVCIVWYVQSYNGACTQICLLGLAVFSKTEAPVCYLVRSLPSTEPSLDMSTPPSSHSLTCIFDKACVAWWPFPSAERGSVQPLLWLLQDHFSPFQPPSHGWADIVCVCVCKGEIITKSFSLFAINKVKLSMKISSSSHTLSYL